MAGFSYIAGAVCTTLVVHFASLGWSIVNLCVTGVLCAPVLLCLRAVQKSLVVLL